MILSSFKYFIFSTILLGFAYPLVITGLGKVMFNEQVNGSMIKDDSGNIRGSFLIAQKHEDSKYFWPRLSGVDYNSASSGATNLSLTHKDLRAAIEARKKSGAVSEALFSSGSGLDPEISPENALSQVSRISKARNIDSETLSRLILENTQSRDWHFLGEKRVNVMKLNLALDKK